MKTLFSRKIVIRMFIFTKGIFSFLLILIYAVHFAEVIKETTETNCGIIGVLVTPLPWALSPGCLVEGLHTGGF